MPVSKSTSQWTSRLLEWIDLATKIGAVFAVLFAIHQYLAARQDARVERTLDYVQSFNDRSQVGAARRRISEDLWRSSDQLMELGRLMEELPTPQASDLRNRFVWKLVDGTAERPGFRSEVHDVLSFFDDLAICVATELCDRESAISFFGDYVKDFWANFESFIIEHRVLAQDYGEGIESMVNWTLESTADLE